ncbi:hypothetical protein RGQ29_010335 [Quercus rubra]|uniref:Mitochondrial glycoprotein n=1 Tax=Quercus rubra TaxID=3512 RepID=A0AAN7J727_QUERU|nr:hypothetical protein RGQ29_010335 [Quercus rubra]KAK4600641.1 hypothetical protein RGQ29_010335 [Quercus rubra]
MATLIRTAQRTLLRSSSSSSFLFQPTRPYSSDAITKSPFESNILRILRTEINYQFDYAPPHQAATKFDSFSVQDRPGKQLITMSGKFGDTENVKIEATMFDGCVAVPKLGDESSGQDFALHLSLIVDISKGDGLDELEFVCSAWPNFLEIQKVYMLRRDALLAMPYLGPDYRKMDAKLQKALKEYLEARGVNDELAVFLHEFMVNKDRTELIRWLGNVKTFVEE